MLQWRWWRQNWAIFSVDVPADERHLHVHLRVFPHREHHLKCRALPLTPRPGGLGAGRREAVHDLGFALGVPVHLFGRCSLRGATFHFRRMDNVLYDVDRLNAIAYPVDILLGVIFVANLATLLDVALSCKWRW